MGGFGDFARRMDTLALEIEPRAAAIQRKAALAADQTIVLATPVDTGRARSNWQTSQGAPIAEEREAYLQGEGGSTVAANSQAAIEQGKRAVVGHKYGVPIYIANNVPYIGALNDGSSAQAPAGFVEQALQSAVAAVDREAPDFLRVRRLP